jgi:hypothetical protein
MPTVSRLNQEEYLEVAQPEEDIMFEPEGRSRNGLRYEFAPANRVSASDRYVTKGNAPFVHPDSDFAYGDSGLGESVGNVDIVVEEGEPRELFRATHGFSVDMEDETVDANWVSENRDAILSFFDAQADIGFLNGVDDGSSGDELRKGMLQWLDDHATDVIDAGSYGVDADLNGVPANIISSEAYGSTTGEYVDNSWMDAVAPHGVWSDWNQIGNNDGSGQQSQWESLANNEVGVGVEGRISIPDFITPARTPPSMDGDLRVDIDFPTASNGGDKDVMWLLPDHGGDFVQLYEMGTPMTHEVEKEGFRRRVEYLWRYGQVYDNSFKASSGTGTDIVKIENVSTLF